MATFPRYAPLALMVGIAALSGCSERAAGVDVAAPQDGAPPATQAAATPAPQDADTRGLQAVNPIATEPQSDPADAGPMTTDAVSAKATAEDAGSAWPGVIVHKTPTCGCCSAWVDHLRGAGFVVEVRDADNLEPVKSRLGIPFGKGSCHTAEVAGYYVEGHVPVADIQRLLVEKPAAKGLVLPGMPLGSPGMEVPDGTVQPYTVELVARDGTTSPFTEHGQ